MDLVEHHFRSYGNTPDHICYPTFRRLFQEIEARGPEGMRDLNILETGIAAWGTSSTYLFDAYIRRYGGRFWSADINREAIDRALPHMCPGTTLIHGDSVAFLSDWAATTRNAQAHVVYLDSYDLDWQNPGPSGDHGLKEYNAVLPCLKPGSLLLIDDTPKGAEVFRSWHPALYQDISRIEAAGGRVPGKGMYVLEQNPPATLLAHWYQVLYRF